MTTTRMTGAGLGDDQRALLDSIERQPGPLEPWQQGQLAALRLTGTATERDRIDRLTGRGAPAPQTAPPAATRDGYEQHLAQARAQGVCPTCGKAG